MKHLVQLLLPFSCIVLLLACSPGVIVLKEPSEPRLSTSAVFLQLDTTTSELEKRRFYRKVISAADTVLPSKLRIFAADLSDALKKRSFTITFSRLEAELVLVIRVTDLKAQMAIDVRYSQKTILPDEAIVAVHLEAATFRITYLDRAGTELCIIEREFTLTDSDKSSVDIVADYTLDAFALK